MAKLFLAQLGEGLHTVRKGLFADNVGDKKLNSRLSESCFHVSESCGAKRDLSLTYSRTQGSHLANCRAKRCIHERGQQR